MGRRDGTGTAVTATSPPARRRSALELSQQAGGLLGGETVRVEATELVDHRVFGRSFREENGLRVPRAPTASALRRRRHDALALEAAQQALGLFEDTFRNAGEARDVDPVATVRRARDETVQEDDTVGTFPDREVRVLRGGKPPDEVGELVVVRREETSGPGRVVDVPKRGPRDREAVEGAGPAADLVEQDEGTVVGRPQDLGDLAHLDHEARLPATDLVRESHPGEQLRHESDPSELRGHERAGLGEHDEKSDLAHVGRFPRHVRTREDEHPSRVRLEVGVVRDERFPEQSVEHGMTTVPYHEDRGVVDRGANVATGLREVSERGEDIELAHRPAHAMNGRHVPFDGVEQLLPSDRLGRPDPFPGLEDPPLDLLELVGGEPFGLGDGLTPAEVGRDAGEVRLGDLDVVAEHLIVSDLERPDAGRFLLGVLEGGHLAERDPLRVPPAVHLGRVTETEQLGGFIGQGGGLGESGPKQSDESCGGGELAGERTETGGGLRLSEVPAQRFRGLEPGTERDQLVGPDAPSRDARRDPGQVGNRPKTSSPTFELGAAVDERLDGVLA
jgi:hypothetical protein